MNDKIWISPDSKIRKVTVIHGKIGLNPTENSECFISITDCKLDVEKFNNSPVIVGDIDTSFGRLLEKCLLMMNCGEKANVTFRLEEGDVSFNLELKRFEFDGYIYEWDAQKKYNLAVKHKNKGTELFKTDYVDASYKFSKAIKLLASIPIEVESPPTVVDDVSVKDIYNLKCNLYNNLASCHLKHQDYDIVIHLCNKVLETDPDNVKALYKLGVSYDAVLDFDRAHEKLKRLVTIDPSNKAAMEKLKNVIVKVNQANARVNAMVKKMFI